MADEKIVTSIVANSDFSNLIADVQRVTGSLSKLQQQFAGANRALAGQIDATNAMFSETMRKTGQFSTHFVSLTSDVEKFGRNLDSGRLKLRDYFRTYQEHSRTTGGLIRDLAKQQVQLQNAVLQPLGRNAQGLMQYNVHIPRGLDLTKNKAALLKQELQIMNKVIQDGGVQLINWGKNTQWAGRQLTVGLTLPLAAFGKAAADAFKVADQELTRLTKVYGDVAGTSAQELGKVRKEVAQTAKELSSAMGVNFAETIGLAADIAATGKTGNELLSSIKETTRLAVLGEVDRQEAMKATLAIQSAFKSNTDELAESINFLNAVENQTSTTLNDLVEAIPKAGPVIKGLGGSVQDLALYLTAMREGGINASEGANALKSALASLINPTDKAVEKFKGLGIDLLGIVNKNAGDTTATLLALQAALDRLNPLQKQQAIEQLFGKFQYSRLNALFENLGRQGSQTLQVLDLMKASASELEAVAGRELAAVTESASGRYRRAIETLRAELAGVGDQFLDIGTKLVNVLSKVIDFAQKLPDPIKKIMAFGGAFTAIIGPVIMLTGVLANFFGYIIKGLGHFKALFKGAEGFKLLTPEIIAAKAAGAQLAGEFYSDALAADSLRLAIEKLNEDLILLQKNATGISKTGSSVGKVITTLGGSPLLTVGGPRMVDPEHPLLGGESRAAAHLNPRDPNNPSTIFGLTMQPIPLNRKLGRTPQIMMSERLPNIEGLTSVGGYSTGVVAGEHARYAALMATLGVQSRQEIEALKKTISLGGQVSSEFIATFDDILPITQRLTMNAAAQSAAIVADLRAGKINVEQARAAIIAANADLERMMGVEVSQYAALRGRTIDLTKAPLIDQPVVDLSGKPNLRGMFRQGAFLDVMSAVGRATRTRTFGGPYSIETTRPQGLNDGGKVFYNNGDQVPGPSVNADVVPAMLTPGEFVIRRDIAQQDPEAMRALNEGRAMVIPFQANSGGMVPGYNLGSFVRAVSARSATASRTRDIAVTGRLGRHSWQTRNSRLGTEIDNYLSAIANPVDRERAAFIIQQFAGRITTSPNNPLGRSRYPGVIQPGHISREEIGLSAILQANGLPALSTGVRTHQTHLTRSSVPIGGGQRYVSRYVADYDWLSNQQAKTGNLTVSNFITRNIGRKNKYNTLFKQVGVPEDRWQFAEEQIDEQLQSMLAGKEGLKIGDDVGDLIFERDFIPIIDQVMVNNGASPSQITAIKRNTVARASGSPSPFGKDFRKIFNLNRGGVVPGYIGGGGIQRATVLARLGAKFKFEGKSYDGKDALGVYRIKSLDVNGGRKFFGNIPGLSDKAKGALYASTVDFFNSNIIKGDLQGGKRTFNSRFLLTAMPTIASNAITWNKGWLSEKDMAILQGISGKGGTLTGTVGSAPYLSKVSQTVFRNRGGFIPGYQEGGNVRGGLLSSLLFGSLGSIAGSSLGSRFGTGGSMIGGMLGYMIPDLLMGRAGRGGISAAQRLGVSSMMTPNIGAFGRPLTAGTPLATMTPIPQIPGRQQSIFAQGTPFFGRFAGSVQKATESSSKFTQVLGKIGLGLTRTNVALGVVAGAVTLGIKAWNNYQKQLEVIRASSGLTAESAGKLGLKFKDYSSTIKDTVAASKLWMDQNKAIYEGMTAANAPFKMTITEYKNLRKEVKNTMQAQIELINSTKKADLPRLATQLKAMFVSAGMSAQEAAQKIYVAFSLSNKAADSYMATLGNASFNAIQNAESAAKAAIETFNYVKENIKDTEAQINALNTAMNGMLNVVQTSVSEAEKKANKDKTYFNETEARLKAEKELMQDLSRLKFEPIGDATLAKLAETDRSILKIYNSADTLKSMFQKTSLLNMGFTGNMLQYNTDEIDRIYSYAVSQQEKIIASNKKGVLSAKYSELEGLRKAIIAAETAAKGESLKTQMNRRDRIKYLEEEIKKINEAADARKKALQEEAEDQDINIEIQKKRLEYQQRLASGDMAGAAQAQLDLQQTINRQQRTLTERAIEEKRIADVAPFQAEIDKLNDAASDAADAAALAGESADKLRTKFDELKTNIDNFNKNMLAQILDKAYNNGANLDVLGAAAKSLGRVLGLTEDQLKKILNIPDATTTTAKSPDEARQQSQTSTTPRPDTSGAPVTNKPKPQIKTYNYNAGTDLGFFTEDELKKANIQRKRGTTFVGSDGKTYYLYNFDDINSQWQYKISPKQPKYAGGGSVTGPGTGTSDSILARLSDGEFVWSSKAVQNAGGAAAVDAMHQYYKNAPGFKDGGPVDSKSIFGMNYIPNTAGAMIGLAKRAKGYIERDKNSPISKALTEAIGSAVKDFDLWCGVFINWLAKTVGVKLPNVTYTPAAYYAFQKMGRLYSEPKPGDIAFFDFERAANQITDHVGLVTSVGAKTITTIDGNTSSSDPRNGGTVASKIRPWGKWNKGLGIFTRGFGRPDYKAEMGGVDFAPHSASQREAAAATSSSNYIVKKGDTLFDIAKQNNITLKDIFKANPKFLSDPKYKDGRNIYSGTEVVIPKFAGGGYVNPSYMSNMKIPSYETGVKFLYNDTIAQLHAREAVLPENMNPWNPNATNPIGGATYYVQPTINAAPGMDEMALARMATDMTLKALQSTNNRRLAMDGRSRLA